MTSALCTARNLFFKIPTLDSDGGESRHSPGDALAPANADHTINKAIKL